MSVRIATSLGGVATRIDLRQTLGHGAMHLAFVAALLLFVVAAAVTAAANPASRRSFGRFAPRAGARPLSAG